MKVIFLVYMLMISISDAHEHGAPCAAQYTMRPNQQYHGPPQDPEESPVPYYFSITDNKGNPINHYRGDEVYTLRLYGGKTYFRGFLIQARLATRDRFVIGHLRSGEFLLEPETYERYGVQIQSCPAVFNDSVTHVESSEKKFLELNWRVTQNDGPIQFMLTVVRDRHVYWQEWKPESGFILPAENFNFKKHASRKYGPGKLPPLSELTTQRPDDEIVVSNVTVAHKQKLRTQANINSTTPKKIEITTTISDYDYVYGTGTIPTDKNDGFPEENFEETELTSSHVVLQKSTNDKNVSTSVVKNFKPSESLKIAPAAVVSETEDESINGDKRLNFSLNIPAKKEFLPKIDPKLLREIIKPQIGGGFEKTSAENANVILPPQAGTDRKVSGAGTPKVSSPRRKTSDKSEIESSGRHSGENEDPCASSPCQNNGACIVDTDGEYACNCTGSYTGFDCSQYDYCSKHKCKNGATCANEETDYKCQCEENFAGKFCQVKCIPSFCQNDGECVADEGDKPSCACAPGFTGDRCQTDIDECASNPCVSGATCEDRKNSFHCSCPDGYMGERCHRPCQDIYKSCIFWRDQDQCELRRPSTNFFDVNCAVSCEQCVFDNDTSWKLSFSMYLHHFQQNRCLVITNIPIPPALEPLEFLLGQWYINSTSPKRVPVDFDHSPSGYYEEVELSIPFIPMFGTPSINYSAVATSNDDKNNVHFTVGFMTLKPNTNPTPVSLMSTENGGVTMNEEGLLKGGEIHLELVYVATFPEVKDKVAPSIKRTFGVRNGFLQESATKTDENGKEDSFTKYYYRKTNK